MAYRAQEHQALTSKSVDFKFGDSVDSNSVFVFGSTAAANDTKSAVSDNKLDHYIRTKNYNERSRETDHKSRIHNKPKNNTNPGKKPKTVTNNPTSVPKSAAVPSAVSKLNTVSKPNAVSKLNAVPKPNVVSKSKTVKQPGIHLPVAVVPASKAVILPVNQTEPEFFDFSGYASSETKTSSMKFTSQVTADQLNSLKVTTRAPHRRKNLTNHKAIITKLVKHESTSGLSRVDTKGVGYSFKATHIPESFDFTARLIAESSQTTIEPKRQNESCTNGYVPTEVDDDDPSDDEEPWEFDSSKMHSITAMRYYQNQSFEELRFDHYLKTFGGFHFLDQLIFGTSYSGTGLYPHGTTIKFYPVPGIDDYISKRSAKTSHKCITAMTEYSRFCLEELRLDDYVANRRSKKHIIEPVGSILEFSPLRGSDTLEKPTKQGMKTVDISTKHYCITAMKTYENKSIEELRLDDYLVNRISKPLRKKLELTRDASNPIGVHYSTVSALFYDHANRKSYRGPKTIDSIFLYENPSLQVVFENARSQMASKYPGSAESDYILAFHGTPDPKNINRIARENFRMDKLQRCKFGWGVYFSEFPDISLGYAGGSMKLLLCKILPGRSHEGDCGRSGSDTRCGCDSHRVEKGADDRGKMIVMFDTDRILPCYELHLSR